MRIEEAVLVDTSAILAMFNPHMQDHELCEAVGHVLPLGKAFICWPVVTETAYLLRNNKAIQTEFLASVHDGEFSLIGLGRLDVPAIQTIIDKYHDQEVDLADAAIVHLANRENIRAIFTLDRRHFRLFTRSDGSPFRLLPDDFEP